MKIISMEYILLGISPTKCNNMPFDNFQVYPRTWPKKTKLIDLAVVCDEKIDVN